MPTLRTISREAFQTGLYEAQDVLAETGDADLIDLQPGPGFRARDRWQRRLLFRGLTQGLTGVNPGLQRVRLTRDYDLFVAFCQNFWDLLYINAIDGWQDRCKTSVCWLAELWASDIQICAPLLRRLRMFDHVFVNSQGTVAPLSDFLERQCHRLATGIDAARFSPLRTHLSAPSTSTASGASGTACIRHCSEPQPIANCSISITPFRTWPGCIPSITGSTATCLRTWPSAASISWFRPAR